MSQHLTTLYQAGVLGKRREGVQIYYRIIDDRVAALCRAAGVAASDMRSMLAPATQKAIAAFLLTQPRRQLDRLAAEQDIPLHTLSK